MTILRERIIKYAVIVSSTLLLLLFIGFFFLMQSQLKRLVDDEIDQYIATVESTIDNVSAFTEDYERILNERLYNIAKNVRFELDQASATDITPSLLKRIQSTYDLAGIAIFVPDGDAFRILTSTNPKEIDEDTASWGYWNTAFYQLFHSRHVTVDRGTFYEKEFWVGPRSLSYYQEGYYRFAYILSDDEQYLINVFISDESMDKYIYSSHIDSALKRLQRGVAHVEAISIIDVKLWQSFIDNKDGGNNDPYIKYGHFQTAFINALDLGPESLVIKEKRVFQIDTKKDHLLILYRIDEGNVLAIMLNQTLIQTASRLLAALFSLLALALIAVTAIAVPLIIAKYSKLTVREAERTKGIERFNQTLKEIPDILYSCVKKNGDYHLIYNEGRDLLDAQIIVHEDQSKSLEMVYPSAYVDAARPGIDQAFLGKRSTFHIEYLGRYFEHTFIPLASKHHGHLHIDEVVVTATDITERVVREHETIRRTLTDDLTGLPNRRAVKEAFLSDISHMQAGEKAFLMYLDLNRFKPINDTFGHHIGDKVLQEVARRLHQFDSNTCIIGRVGGDEFVAWLTHVDERDVLHLKQGIADAIAKPIYCEGEHSLTISIGYSCYPTDGVIFEALVTCADKAMYSEKNAQKLLSDSH